ncbi:MAG: BREX-1 system adenine-specific DNA-methyltransferase PglX [bacterium]
MKLAEHTEKIRQLIDKAFRNRMGRMGIAAANPQPIDNIPAEYREDRKRMEYIHEIFIEETGSLEGAYEKLIEECTFTLFNRLAALKVMEAHTLHPEIITRRTQHGDRSFTHFLWLEQNPQGRDLEQEGLVQFLESQLSALSDDIPLFSPHYLFHLLPTAIELNGIINAFNQIENDTQIDPDIWKSDDVLGWLYESYNNYKKATHKESKEKTEYNKVSIQSQVYTPRWVVKFLVDNSLGKLYLEMYPDSEIIHKYKIANAPKTQIRHRKPLTEIRLIDLANGSGNFLLYGFDLFYDLYIDQIENYGVDYNENEIPELIIHHNLHGIDLDDRAVQLAQLGLYIKVKRRKRSAKIDHFNVVSSDFFLPEYEKVKHLFDNGGKIEPELEKIIVELWGDLQQAYKFGSLLRLGEKFSSRLNELVQKHSGPETLFGPGILADYEEFRNTFFDNLQKAVAHNAERQGRSFLNTKTGDAIIFLRLMTQKYDVAVANPPYTDSADYGLELKKFIELNYKKPHKFNTNLYATFIKRCWELTGVNGKIAMIHPRTFMYIKTFEDVRKFILGEMHINVLAELGCGGVFEISNVAVDAVMYIFDKGKSISEGTYFDLKFYHNYTKKGLIFNKIYKNYLNSNKDKHVFVLNQSKLKIIEGWPFIYWISDGFREKFREKTLNELFNPAQGVATTDNNRFLRFWWEVDNNIISNDYKTDNRRWIYYAKGGPFNKWYGNLWVVLDWGQSGQELKKAGAVLRNSNFYFQEGITYSASGSKGGSFRYLPANCIFDTGGSCIFLKKEYKNLYYLIAFLNSQLSSYVIGCLNPTVNMQVGDLQRIPIVKPSKSLETLISALSLQNVDIKKHLCSYQIVETTFNKVPLTALLKYILKEKLLAYFNYENAQLTLILLNEAIINNLIFEVYSLSPEDRQQVEAKMGKPVGELPISAELRITNNKWEEIKTELGITKEQEAFVDNLSTEKFEEDNIRKIKDGFPTLYQSNNDLEEFCIRHQVNPINVWYWFRESKVLPPAHAKEIAMEFIADACRTVLMEDEDGIIPLTGLPGEPRLLDRLEQHCLNQGFTFAQFMQLDGLLGKPINEYLEHHFFKNFSDHLNLFMYLPKTPFIWHLSSGEQQGFEAYIIIYKWNRDSLFKLKTHYLSKRVESLNYRHIQLAESNTAQAQNEKETIRLQLQEIAEFTGKIDELIAEGYNPELDDGVGKNIAPLQKKGLLRCEVLNEKQLEKYLHADW